ncbi:hypothetical protein [Afipia carboxidovorans]|uniref:hypothetical protein n=1 Tax=Afipia carboxidovorans TaxID=40137 RepID=UPI00308E60CE|nr:hypothetical protein CRBSH125_05760 [Afipia carboxidovorans]
MDASDALKELADPRPGGEPVKVAIARASSLSGLSYWRTSDIWYRKARRVEDYEVQQISDALEHKREMEARNELSALRIRIEKLDALLRQTDQGFYRPSIDPVGAPVR